MENIRITPEQLKKAEEEIRVPKLGKGGEIVLSQEEQLVRGYYTYHGLLGDIRDSFDDFVKVGVPKILNSRVSNFLIGKEDESEEFKLTFSNIQTSKPVQKEKGKSVDLYPNDARNQSSTYNAVVTATLTVTGPNIWSRDSNSQFEGKIHNVDIGAIPVMLGSSLCHLSDLSDEGKKDVGDCPTDPLCYFIIKGAEKIITIQDKLRTNIPLIFNAEAGKSPICKYTAYTRTSQTTAVQLSTPAPKAKNVTNPNVININLHFFGKKKDKKTKAKNLLPVVSMFEMMGVKSDIMTVILLFVRDKWIGKVKSVLANTFGAAAQISDPFETVAEFLNIEKVPDRREIIKQLIDKEMFHNINDDGFGNNKIRKIYLLASMTAKYAEFLAGYRDLDNRDNLAFKSLEPPGKSMETLYFNLVNKMIGNFEQSMRNEDLYKYSSKNVDAFMSEIAKKMPNNIITDEMAEAFNPDSWGVKNTSKVKENITEPLRRESILSSYAQSTRINTPTNRKTKQKFVRLVDGSQTGFVCVVETPEGESCGIVRYKASGCSISIEGDENLVYSHVKSEIVTNRDSTHTTCFFLNGKPLGFTDGIKVSQNLTMLKRNLTIYKDTCIIYQSDDDTLNVYTTGTRCTRPLLVVNYATGNLVIDEKNLWDHPFDELLRNGAVEYVDAWEQEHSHVSESVSNLRDKRIRINEIRGLIKEARDESERLAYEEDLKDAMFESNYMHCEMHPSAILSISASIIPNPEKNQGPRNTYQCSMGKQAQGIPSTEMDVRMDPTLKALAWPSRPMTETIMYRQLRLTEIPAGQSVTVAFINYKGSNQEDSIIFNKASLDRGLFMSIVFHTEKEVCSNAKSTKEEFVKKTDAQLYQDARDQVLDSKRKFDDEEFEIQKRANILIEKYKNLGSNGIIREGTVVKEGDVLSLKRRRTEVDGIVSHNYIETKVKLGQEGVVDKVLVGKNAKQERVAKIRIKETRRPRPGDKFASRHAQKGTMSTELPEWQMPFAEDGTIPDICINTHGMPSRMTISKLFEITNSEVGAREGQRKNVTAFSKNELSESKLQAIAHGLDSTGYKRMFSGDTMREFEGEIFIGTCYYQKLKHEVKDKIQATSVAPVDHTTGQPLGGRSQHGGNRVGRMEKDAIVGHSASAFLYDRTCESSDIFSVPICRACNYKAVSIRDVTTQTNTLFCQRCDSGDQVKMCKTAKSSLNLFNVLSGAGIGIKYTFDKK